MTGRATITSRRLAMCVLVCAVFVPGVCEAYTPDRNLATFGGTLLDDLRGLLSGEDWLTNWVHLAEHAEPMLWAAILVGGPIALRVLPTKTLRKYIRPLPMFPPTVVNPADAAKLKTLLKTVDKHIGTWERVLRLFR